jgi:outer membrane biosynthesis protein TonB
MKRLLLLALMIPAGACASASAKTPADRPALEVPPPPPRVIEPLPSTDISPPEPVADLPAAPSTTTSRPRQQPSRETTPRESPKPVAQPETPPETAPAPQPVVPVPAPQSQLRTPGTADGAEAARQVREVIDRTTRALGSVDYRTLSGAQRKAYDDAKEFMQQAEGAIKEANYVFARSLADKAEKLARGLPTR